MGNFRVDTFGPWLSFEGQDDPLASDGFQPQSFGLTPFSYGATSESGGEAVGLSNWRPPGTPTVLESEPRPWWLFGHEPDPNTPCGYTSGRQMVRRASVWPPTVWSPLVQRAIALRSVSIGSCRTLAHPHSSSADRSRKPPGL